MKSTYTTRKDLLFINKKNKKAIALNQIILLKGDINYTYFYLQNGQRRMSARTLKYYEEQLLPNGFIRIHRGCIVNSRCVVELRDSALLLSNGEAVVIARRRLSEVIKML